MKIKELRIGHFGKLHNVTIRLEDGLNLIYGDNESGKSTVYAFIGAMLFGLEKGRGRAGKDDPYTRYQPWEAPGEYRGSMDFEHEGRDYRITRVFYQKEKSCTLTEIATGRKIPLADDSITSLIPGLTKSAYYNTVSMGQTALRCSEDFTGELKNRIANLATTGGSRVDVPGALASLETVRKEYIKELKNLDIDSLRAREQELFDKEKQASELVNKRNEIIKEAEALRKRITELGEKIPDTEELKNDRQKAKTEADEALLRMLEAERKLHKIREKTEPAGNGTEEESTDRLIRRKRLQGGGLMILAVGALLCIAGNERSAIMVGTGVVAAIVAIIMIFVAFIEQRGERKGFSGAGEGGEIIAEGTASEAATPDSEEKNEPEAECEKAAVYYHRLDEKLAEATEKLDRARTEQDRINAAITDLDERADELESRADRIEWELENMGDIGDELDICKHELRDALRKEEMCRDEMEALQLAEDTIRKLSSDIHDSFSESFNELFSEEICLATDGKYSIGRVNDRLEAEVMSGIDFVPAESLSAGAMQQIFTAFRFAAARLFFGNTEVPLLLDECFAYSDEHRLKSALSALADREGYQILLFTCRSSERRILDELGAAYNPVNMEQ